MTNNNNTVSVTYSDSKLRILVEEYITMQRRISPSVVFGDYVFYHAMEEDCTAGQSIYENNELQPADQERIRRVLSKIGKEGRVIAFADNTRVMKGKE